MSLHTGISLILLISSLIFSGLTGNLTGLPFLFISLYAFNIYNDKRETIDSEAELLKTIDIKYDDLNTRIVNNRTNSEVIVKELKSELSEVNGKVGEIRLAASSVKTQQTTNQTRYKF